MKEKKLLIENEVRIQGIFNDSRCAVKIQKDEDSGNYEVCLSDPEDENYMGASSMNRFENFATEVRRSFLNDIPVEKISWFNFPRWKSQEFENLLLKVELTWSNGHYSAPQWKGVAL